MMENAERIDSDIRHSEIKASPSSPEPSVVSMKSNLSLNIPPDLSDGSVISEPV